MKQWIPASLHGLLDYLSAVLLFSLPRMMGGGVFVANLLTVLALFTMSYSLMTRWERRMNHVLPVSPPLVLAFLFGLLLTVTPFPFLLAPQQITRLMAGFGWVEIMFFLLTQCPSALEARR